MLALLKLLIQLTVEKYKNESVKWMIIDIDGSFDGIKAQKVMFDNIPLARFIKLMAKEGALSDSTGISIGEVGIITINNQ